jgi:hypothetical protein
MPTVGNLIAGSRQHSRLLLLPSVNRRSVPAKQAGRDRWIGQQRLRIDSL